MTDHIILVDDIRDLTADSQGRVSLGIENSETYLRVGVIEGNSIADVYDHATDSRGRFNLGSEYAGEEVKFAVFARGEADE